MQRTLDDVVGALRAGRKYKRPCSLMIGAGCSASAGVKTAAGFVELIKEHHRPAYDRAKEKTYPHCMAALDSGYRRDLIVDQIRAAKINWAHVAIAQLIAHGYVDCVLTTNFDPLVARACALVGEFPAVYDFAASTTFDPAGVAEKAVFHLHGQSTGFALMNTEDECFDQGQQLGPLFDDAGRGRSWIVVGYSGDNDPVFKHLAGVTRFEYGLYWVGYLDAEPSQVLRDHLLRDGKQAYFVKGYDADRFFVELARKLECFPPRFVERPFSHLRGMFDAFAAFVPPGASGASGDVDVLDKPRRLLDRAIGDYEPKDGEPAILRSAEAQPQTQDALELAATALLMAGKYGDVQAVAERLDEDTKASMADVIAWSFIGEGNDLYERAKGAAGNEAPEALFREAGKKYAEAVRIKPDMHEALYNWGLALADWARTRDGEAAEALFREAGEKYAEAVRIKPDKHEALNNWGLALADWARTRDGEAAEALFREAGKKYAEAVRIKPDKHEALNNWGSMLADWALTRDGEAAEALFREAGEKYAEAVRIKPDMHEAFNNWGLALAGWARTRDGEAAEALFREAGKKYAEAVRIKPDMHEALYNWGLALADWARTRDGEAAEALFREAGEKYAEAVRIKPDKHEALNNWGSMLLVRAQRHSGAERQAWLDQAEDKLKRAEAVKRGSGAYNLACVNSLGREEDQCRSWLEVARDAGTLPDEAHLESDPDLDPVRETDWFREFTASL